MNKFLIYGSKGWIGGQVIQYLQSQGIEYLIGEKRVDDTDGIKTEIQQSKCSHVLCFIGRTHGYVGNKEYTTIDYLEQPGKLVENLNDNLFAPISLSLVCIELNIHCTYLGTGCIFQYDFEHPFAKEINGFLEDDKPNFFGSSYSIVKGFTDRLMHQLNSNVLNVRIRMPINSENIKRNFITKITTYKKICSIPNSMTVLPTLIPVMIDMAIKKQTGTINLCNPGLISHNEILEMYKEIVDPHFTWENMTLEEQNQILAAGRSNNFMDTSKLISLYPNIPNIKDAVREVLQKYNK